MTTAALAKQIRLDVLDLIATTQSGHIGSALGMADMLAVLYEKILVHQPNQPHWPGRDYVVLSSGHTCPVLYATLANCGYFPKEELTTFGKLGSRLQGHPKFGSISGIENNSGSLGQGISQACGIALGLKLSDKTNRVYCLMSDGEHQEGQTWEAYQFGLAKNLNNLTALIDRNKIQISGYTEEVLPLEPFKAKLIAFGWHVFEVDGHNHQQLLETLKAAKEIKDRPQAIIYHTLMGKGVSFMENEVKWHDLVPSKKQAIQAKSELERIAVNE